MRCEKEEYDILKSRIFKLGLYSNLSLIMKGQNKNNEKQPEVELLLQQVSLTMSKITSFGQPANSALDISVRLFWRQREFRRGGKTRSSSN